jgi:DNA-binding PadR family transcriptional regulator
LFYNVEVMSDDLYLGEFEQLVLLAVLRLGDEAYGMRVRRELLERAKRDTAIGAVYATLDRLEAKKLLRSAEREAEPAAHSARQGRMRRVFAVTAQGKRALERMQSTLARMSDGLDLTARGNA